ncbi:MAG: DUF2207 domain-containing protein [Elusimicrobiaceae bacterium]|nr:DUF2207 domain-containing protein [Elusimicrobiaceae bacterium]
MKNLFKLLAFILCFVFSLPVFAEEKINNFKVRFELNKNASATITEYITITAEHNQIRRGIYRKIPKDINRSFSVKSLYMDGEKHPYTVTDEDKFINVSFGDDYFLPYGEHTYIFTYEMSHVVEANLFYDFLQWNVTGGVWTLPIEKASFTLSVPNEVNPLNKKIKSYTGGKKSKDVKQLAGNIFLFQSSQPLKEGEVFTAYFPMKKGIFKFEWYEIKYMPVVICAIIVLYYFIIWCLIGRDPLKRKLPYRSKPPQNVSAGFASYFLNGPFSPKNLATAFASLIVKKKVKLTFQKWKPVLCEKISDAYSDLEEDEARLFMSFPSEFRFNEEGYKHLAKGLRTLNFYYETKIDDYIINNFVYMLFPIIFFIAMLFYFYFRGVVPYVLYSLVLNFILPMIVGVYMRNTKRIVITVIIFLIVSAIGISNVLSYNALLNLNVLAILITTFLSALFVHLINNLMYEGMVLRDELDAFKRYMVIAEKDRVALSNPTVAGRIFCDYLPYAYAFGMESEWFKKFEHKIDFRLQDEYRPLTSSTLLSVGLLLTITTALHSREMTSSSFVSGLGIGKGHVGGGGGR